MDCTQYVNTLAGLNYLVSAPGARAPRHVLTTGMWLAEQWQEHLGTAHPKAPAGT